MSSGSKSHYFYKRMQQLKQKNAETKGVRTATSFDEEFKRMEDMTRHMEKAYTRIPDKLDQYLQPDPTKRMSKMVLKNKDTAVTEDMIAKENLCKMGQAMIDAGYTFGEETTLGCYYLKAGTSQQEITKSWLAFQYEANRMYLKPMELLVEDLKHIKKNLNKIQQDRLYLDSTKTRKEKSRQDIKNYDPSVVQHLQKKAESLQENLEIKAGNVQSQMEQFFYELEDDQILMLQNFIATEIEFHRSALESLTDVVEFMTQAGEEPFVSTILPKGVFRQRDDTPKAQRAVALFDFETNEDDCLPFTKGDVLTITNVDTGEEGWWEAMLAGEIGIIPENYVELLDDEAAVQNNLWNRNRQSESDAGPEALPERDTEAAAEKQRVEEELEMLKAQQAELLEQQSLALEHQQVQAAQQLQTGMFAQALDMSLRQLAQTTKGLNEAKKQRSRPDFKANPAGFDGGVELLRSRAQEVMMVTQALMQKASGSLPELQLAVTDAIMKLQELALDTKSLSSSVVDPADRECLFQSVMSMIGGLESLLKQLRQVAGKGKDVTKPAIKPLVKDVIKAIGSVLDVLDATEAQQAKLMEARQKAAEVEVEKQRDTMLDSARKIAQVAKDLAAMSKKAAPAHQAMVGEAQEVTAATASLVEVATECQRIISAATGESSGTKYATANGQWSDGLVSAAKMVASAVQDLSKAADEVSKDPAGKVNPEKIDYLRAVANNINATTMQVVMAGSTKNSDRKLQSKLQSAGKHVNATVDKLVQCLSAGEYDTGASIPNVAEMSEFDRRRAKTEAQAKVHTLQRQLENAQKVLYSLSKRRYSKDIGSIETPTTSMLDMTDMPLPPPPVEEEADFDDLEARLNSLRS